MNVYNCGIPHYTCPRHKFRALSYLSDHLNNLCHNAIGTNHRRYKMALIFTSITILLLSPISAKQVYYPEFALPNAIVFDGPTNIDGGWNQLVLDYDLDVRFNRPAKSNEDNNCPKGYHMEGDVCFPND